jgi:hypothetical protein
MLHYFYETQPVDKQYLRKDRVSQPLNFGFVVSAVMRKEVVEGERLNVVDIEVTRNLKTTIPSSKIMAAADPTSVLAFHGKN